MHKVTFLRGPSVVLNPIAKRLSVLVVPAAILITTWFLIPRMAGLTPARQELVLLAPYLVTAVGMVLAVHFHRGRPFLALLVLLLFYWGSHALLPEVLTEPAFSRVFQAFALLVPPNIALIALMRERGLFSAPGRMRLAFLTLQAVVALWLFRYNFYDLLPLIAGRTVPLSLLERLLVPQPAVLSGAVCLVFVAALALHRQAPVESGLFGALVAFFIACNGLNTRDIHTAYCLAAALIITLSVLRDSYNLAFRDDLTGIPSRRALNESLQGLGRRYCIAMLDVDHFKRFNDTYGHDVGDQVLKMVASKVAAVGGGGRAYRYGGEEFTIVFPGRSAADALAHLEELRRMIAEYRLALRGSDRPAEKKLGKGQRGRGGTASVSVTVSIGVAENSEDCSSAHEVIKAADRALYKAKNRGRNQISR